MIFLHDFAALQNNLRFIMIIMVWFGRRPDASSVGNPASDFF